MLHVVVFRETVFEFL